MFASLFSGIGLKILGLVAIGAAILAGYLYVSHLKSEVADLTAKAAVEAQQLDQLQATNAANVAEVAKVKADAAAAMTAIAAERDSALARADALSSAKQQVAHAALTDSKTCPVPASIRAAAASLRSHGPAGAPGDANPGSQGGGAGGAAAVPAAAAAPGR